jgi:hypothetical protein
MKVGLTLGLLVLAGGGFAAYKIREKRQAGAEVRLEQVGRRDLISAVTASGKIEPKT